MAFQKDNDANNAQKYVYDHSSGASSGNQSKVVNINLKNNGGSFGSEKQIQIDSSIDQNTKNSSQNSSKHQRTIQPLQ